MGLRDPRIHRENDASAHVEAPGGDRRDRLSGFAFAVRRGAGRVA